MKVVVAATLIKNLPTSLNVLCAIDKFDAVSEEEAVGMFVLKMSKVNPDHNIHVRPVSLVIEERATDCLPTNQMVSALDLLKSIRVAFDVLATMMHATGLKAGERKAVDMGCWIDDEVERLNAALGDKK